MNKIVEEAIRKIKELEENTPCGKHIITGDVRKLSSKLYMIYLLSRSQMHNLDN